MCAFHSEVGQPELGGGEEKAPYCEGEKCILYLLLTTIFKTAKHHDQSEVAFLF
jgi:hypothetical protein